MTVVIPVDITQPLQLIGTPHDINRVMQACQNALKTVEFDGFPLDKPIAVNVAGPDQT